MPVNTTTVAPGHRPWFAMALLAGILPLSRAHTLVTPGPLSLLISMAVVALFWIYIVRQLILPLAFGRDVILRAVNPRLLGLFTAFFVLQFASIFHAYLNGVIDPMFSIRIFVWWLTVFLFSIAVFLTHGSRDNYRSLRVALLAGPVIYTLLNVGLYWLGFERLQIADIFNFRIQNVMLRLFGLEAFVPYYPLAAGPRSLAVLAAASTIICLSWARTRRTLARKLLPWSLAALSFGIVLTTDSRMAVASLIVAIVGYALMRLFLLEKSLRIAPFIAPLFPLLILQVAILVAVLDVSDELSRQRADNISTLSGRSDLWEFVFEEIGKPKPVHLIGYGQYGQVTAGLGVKYAYIFEGQNDDITRKTAHNMVLQTFLDTGYIGVVVLLWLLFEVIRIATEKKSIYNRTYAELLLLVMVFGITSSVPTLVSIEISTFFFVFIGLFTSARTDHTVIVDQRRRVPPDALGSPG